MRTVGRVLCFATSFALAFACAAKLHGNTHSASESGLQSMREQPQTPPISVIPQPSSIKTGRGEFVFTARTGIFAGRGTRDVAEQLRDALRPATGYPLQITAVPGANSISLALDKKLKRLGLEGYRLSVQKTGIQISAFAPAGLFYGVQTLRQLLPSGIFRRSAVDEMRWTVSAVQIEDVPRFSWRGQHLDVARHFMPKEFVLKFLDLMALHKMNVFHWHLVDDQGWRIEIKKYPRLATVGGATDYTTFNPTQPMAAVSLPQGGYYTQDDIREVVRYAAARFITVLPEIEMPGHSSAAIAAYPQFGNSVQIRQAGGDLTAAPDADAVYNVDDATIHFLQDVLSEVLTLFPSKFIHVGGDEVDKRPWRANPVAQQRMRALGLQNEEELQSWVIRQMDTFLTARNRRLVGWDEILEGGLAQGATVMSWRGIDGGIAAANAGHDVVMAPTTFTYFDYYQWMQASAEPKAIAGFLPLENVYSFDPIPPALTPAAAVHVLGGQGQLWSEWMPQEKEVEYMAFPRMCALAETVWSPAAARNFADFSRRLATHLERLKLMDVHYRPLTPMPQAVGHWQGSATLNVGAALPPSTNPGTSPQTRGPQVPFTQQDWDASSAVSGAGQYAAIFVQTQGGGRGEIEWVELRAGDQLVARATRPGNTDTRERQNDFAFTIPASAPGTRYTIRASMRILPGNPTQLPLSGDVYFVKTGDSAPAQH